MTFLKITEFCPAKNKSIKIPSDYLWRNINFHLSTIGWTIKILVKYSVKKYWLKYIDQNYLSQPLQNCKYACFWIPSVISTVVRIQPTHIFDGLGGVGVPHWQHNLNKTRRLAKSTEQLFTHSFWWNVVWRCKIMLL